MRGVWSRRAISGCGDGWSWWIGLGRTFWRRRRCAYDEFAMLLQRHCASTRCSLSLSLSLTIYHCSCCYDCMSFAYSALHPHGVAYCQSQLTEESAIPRRRFAACTTIWRVRPLGCWFMPRYFGRFHSNALALWLTIPVNDNCRKSAFARKVHALLPSWHRPS